jgi:hypothetical protein
MDDTDPAKLEAALEQLEIEKARRRQAKIDAGECVSVRATVVIGPDDDAEDATAEALANLPTSDPEGRAIHYDVWVITTGVPRGDPDQAEPSPQVQTASSEGVVSRPSEEPDRVGPSYTRSDPTYVRVMIRNGDDDGDPGAIAEAYYTIEDGVVVLRDHDDKHLTSRALLKGQDPLAVAAHCCERWRSLKASIARLAIRSWGSRDPGDTHGQRLRSSENSAKRFGVAPLRSSPGYAGVDN